MNSATATNNPAMNSAATTTCCRPAAAPLAVREVRRVPLRLLTAYAATTSRLVGDSAATVWVPPGLRSDRAALLRRRLLGQSSSSLTTYARAAPPQLMDRRLSSHALYGRGLGVQTDGPTAADSDSLRKHSLTV